MKIIHTSDWHLGHKFYDQSQKDEQLYFLEWLLNYIENNHIDVLLIAGDIFDNRNPSSESRKLYYNFLINLKKINCKHIVIIGGNHDSPDNINAPKELLDFFSIHVVGKATKNIKEEVFKFCINDENIIIAGVPYLRDREIRRAIEGENHEEIDDRYKTALVNHYQEVAEYCKSIKTENTTTIAMGHLFAIGGSVSNSEQKIYVGSLGNIGADDFPEIFDYIALGHLHKAQKVNKKNHIRYSGSPNKLSFSEINHDKKLIEIETKKGEISDIKEIEIPNFRKIFRIEGNIENCISQLTKINNEKHKLKIWIEIVLDSKSDIDKINKYSEKLNQVKILKISLKNQKKDFNLKKIEDLENIEDLKPEDVFEKKCKEENFNIKEKPEILDAFKEILQKVKEENNIK